MGVLSGRLGALQEPSFRLLWLARTTSSVGDRMVPIALAFAVLEISHSASDLGLVLAAGMVPNVVFVLAGGVVGDRWPRGRVMLVSDLVRAVSQGVIAVLLLSGHAQLWHLLVSSALWGTAAAFFAPASTGIVPETVSAPHLQQANALMGLTRNIIGPVAPALAGLLVATAGTGFVFAIDSASFVASALCLFALPIRDRPTERKSFVADFVAGWRELVSRMWLWVSILAFCFWNLAIAVFYVLGPFVFDTELGGAGDWGIVMSGSAVGALTGGAIALRWKPSRPLVAAFGVTLVSSLQLFLLVPPAPVYVQAVAAAVAMLGVSIGTTLWTTVLQENVPSHALSRVSAYDVLGSLVVMPLGYAFAGPVADVAGVDATMIGAGALLLVAGLAALATPSVRAVRRAGAVDAEVVPAA
jgi:MFS family permease